MSQDVARREPLRSDCFDLERELACYRLDMMREAGRRQRFQAHEKIRRRRLREEKRRFQEEKDKKAADEEVQRERLTTRRDTILGKPSVTDLVILDGKLLQAQQAEGSGEADPASEASSGSGLDSSDGSADERSCRRVKAWKFLKSKRSKAARVDALSRFADDRRRRTRLQRAHDARQRAFDALPEEEREALRNAFKRAADGGESFGASKTLDAPALKVALDELGVLARTTEEEHRIADVVFSLMESAELVDFLIFCHEAVPRVRQALRLCRREMLLNYFNAYDLDKSGYLSKEECHLLLECAIGLDVDASSFDRAITWFDREFSAAEDRASGEISYRNFEARFVRLQEMVARAIDQRIEALLQTENLAPQEIGHYLDCIVYLHEAFTQSDLDSLGGLLSRQVSMLLSELGLWPTESEAHAEFDVLFRNCAAAGSQCCDFFGFLQIVWWARKWSMLAWHWPIKEIFDRFDMQKAGKLKSDVASKILRCMGFVPRSREDKVEMQRLLSEAAQSSGSSELTFHDVERLALRVRERLKAQQRRRIRRAAEIEFGLSMKELASFSEVFHTGDAEANCRVVAEQVSSLLEVLQVPPQDPQEVRQMVSRFGFSSPASDHRSAAVVSGTGPAGGGLEGVAKCDGSVRIGQEVFVIDFEGFLRLLMNIIKSSADT